MEEYKTILEEMNRKLEEILSLLMQPNEKAPPKSRLELREILDRDSEASPNAGDMFLFIANAERGDLCRVAKMSDGRRSTVKVGQEFRVVSVKSDRRKFGHIFWVNLKDEKTGKKPAPVKVSVYFDDKGMPSSFYAPIVLVPVG